MRLERSWLLRQHQLGTLDTNDWGQLKRRPVRIASHTISGAARTGSVDERR